MLEAGPDEKRDQLWFLSRRAWLIIGGIKELLKDKTYEDAQVAGVRND